MGIEHRYLINFAKIDRNILGAEPRWVEKARKLDRTNIQKKNGQSRVWTKQEDARLKQVLKTFRYTYPELAAMFNRTESAIKRRIYDLRLKERPIKKVSEFWTPEQMEMAVTLYRSGYGLNEIAQKVGKSELALRGKLEREGLIQSKENRQMTELREPHRGIRLLAFMLGQARAAGKINADVIANCMDAVRDGVPDKLNCVV